MLEKLLAFLLHAKAGAITGTLLLAATGALVSISAQNGVTTITVTQASPTPTATAPSSSSSSGPNLFVPSSSESTVSTGPNPDQCADEAHAIAFQVQRVDSAFKGFHTDLMHLRDTRSRDTLQTADKTLKAVREAAVKAIHKTRACEAKKDDDEDKDEANDEDSATSNSDEHHGDEHQDKDHKDKDQAPAVTFTGTDPTAIADQAIAAMKTAFDAANNAPATTPKAARTHKPEGARNGEPTRSPKPTHSPDRP